LGAGVDRQLGERIVDAVFTVCKASAIAHDADHSGRTPREAALESAAISAEDFGRIVNPANMVGPF
jgi:fumarate hydratase class II